MSFYSTRGGACVTASQAILGGLAKDGGLFVPSMFPQITMERLSAMAGTSYQNHAERILRSFLEDYSIAEIGCLCGYDDALYFSRVFKKRFGCSPSVFAKNHLKSRTEK